MRIGWAAWVLLGCGTAPSPSGGAVQIAISGEALALGGYAFPSANPDAPIFADGWEVKFAKMIVMFDHIALSEGADSSPSDPSTTGRKIAQIDGPWAVDLHQGGPLLGKGGSDERALAIETIANQNLNGNAPFDPTVRYAFGFESVAASASTKLTNVDATDADWQEMVKNGWNVLYVGTATWRGDSSCSSSDPSYDFSALPKGVNFRLGFLTPTRYINCQSPDNDPAKGLGGEDHQRGVQVKEHRTTVAQVTFHTDHPFWEGFAHELPLRFDQFAALAKKQPDHGYLVTSEDTVGVNYTAFQDRTGKPLPWRSCTQGFMPPNMNKQMGFDSLAIPFNPASDPSKSLRDYRDFINYSQSTQGHLNSDGLCYVQRNYPSPP